MQPTNLLTLSAIFAVAVGVVLAVFGLLQARKARDGAFYGMRREARLSANRRFAAAFFVFALAGILFVSHYVAPDLTIPLAYNATPVVPDAATASPPDTATPQPAASPTTPATMTNTPAAAATVSVATVTPSATLSVETLPTLAPASNQRLALHTVASSIDANGLPVGEGTRFPSRTKEVFVFFDFQNVPPSALVRHTWFHNNGSVFFRSDALNRNGSGMAALSWAPNGGFEPGLYEVRVLLGNVPQFVANFEIR